jgi:hypothetical protein
MPRRKGRPTNGGSGGYTRVLSKPSGRFPMPNMSHNNVSIDQRLIIEGASGAKYDAPIYGGGVLPGEVGAYLFMPTAGTVPFCSLAASANGPIAGLPAYLFSCAKELMGNMVADRLPIGAAQTGFAQADLSNYFLTLYSVMGGLRTLQALYNTPNINPAIGLFISQVTFNEFTIRGLIEQVQSLGTWPMMYDLVDATCGVMIPEPTGPAIIGIPQNGTYVAGTILDLSTIASIQTYLANIATNVALLQTGNLGAVSNLLISAYGVVPWRECSYQSDQRAYDMWLYKNNVVSDTTSGFGFSVPSVPMDIGFGNRIPLPVRRKTWRDGDLIAKCYSSLFRVSPGGLNTGVTFATLELDGLLSDGVTVAAATVYNIYPKTGGLTNVKGIQAAASTGLTLTDPVSYMFPWAKWATFEATTFAANVRESLPDVEIVEVTLNNLADNTYYIINEMFKTGYRGRSTS